MMILLFFKNASSKILNSPIFLSSNKFVMSFSKNICKFFIDFFSNNFIMISLTELFSVLHQNCFVIQTFSSKSNLVRDIFLVITSKGSKVGIYFKIEKQSSFSMNSDLLIKGWNLKKGWFSFYSWCIQSELSLVKHGQKSKVRTVLKFSGSQILFLIFDHVSDCTDQG